MSDTTFLELVDEVGVESAFIVDQKTGLEVPNPKAGEPGPLTHEGIQIPVPTQAGDDIVFTTRVAQIEPKPEIKPDWYDNPVDLETGTVACARIIPGTRVIETNAPPIVSVLLESGKYRLCDPPKSNIKARAASGKGEASEASATSTGGES